MLNSRRELLHSAASLAALLSIPSSLFSGQSNRPTPQPLPSPNAPDPRFPQGMNGPGPSTPDQRTINKQNLEQLRTDVDKLYSLAVELKQELGVTHTTAVYSVAFVKNAKQIEKLAKEIRDLAKG